MVGLRVDGVHRGGREIRHAAPRGVRRLPADGKTASRRVPRFLARSFLVATRSYRGPKIL